MAFFEQEDKTPISHYTVYQVFCGVRLMAFCSPPVCLPTSFLSYFLKAGSKITFTVFLAFS